MIFDTCRIVDEPSENSVVVSTEEFESEYDLDTFTKVTEIRYNKETHKVYLWVEIETDYYTHEVYERYAWYEFTVNSCPIDLDIFDEN